MSTFKFANKKKQGIGARVLSSAPVQSIQSYFPDLLFLLLPLYTVNISPFFVIPSWNVLTNRKYNKNS